MKFFLLKVYLSWLDNFIHISISWSWGLKSVKHGIEEDELRKWIGRVSNYLGWSRYKEHFDQERSSIQAKIDVWNQQIHFASATRSYHCYFLIIVVVNQIS